MPNLSGNQLASIFKLFPEADSCHHFPPTTLVQLPFNLPPDSCSVLLTCPPDSAPATSAPQPVILCTKPCDSHPSPREWNSSDSGLLLLWHCPSLSSRLRSIHANRVHGLLGLPATGSLLWLPCAACSGFPLTFTCLLSINHSSPEKQNEYRYMISYWFCFSGYII